MYAPVDPLVAVTPVTQFGVAPPGGTLSALYMLESEVEQLLRYLSPSAEECQVRAAAVASIDAAVRAAWPTARVAVFGSTDTGLYLPSSDVDLVVHYRPLPADGGERSREGLLYDLAWLLEASGQVRDVRVFAHARVPIVRCRHRTLVLDLDVSLNHAVGEDGALLTKRLLSEIPLLRQVVVVLKHALAHRGLNESYNGGLGSFALLVLAYFFCQRVVPPELRTLPLMNAARITVGGLVLGFLDYFGRLFDYRAFGLRLHSWVPKPAAAQGMALETLYLESPLDPRVDLGQNVYNLPVLRQAFLQAHNDMMRRMHALHATFLQRWHAAATAAAVAAAAAGSTEPAPVDLQALFSQAYMHLRAGGAAGASAVADADADADTDTDTSTDTDADVDAKAGGKQGVSTSKSAGQSRATTPPPQRSVPVAVAHTPDSSSGSNTSGPNGRSASPLQVGPAPDLYLLVPLVGEVSGTMLGYRAQLHGTAQHALPPAPGPAPAPDVAAAVASASVLPPAAPVVVAPPPPPAAAAAAAGVVVVDTSAMLTTPVAAGRPAPLSPAARAVLASDLSFAAPLSPDATRHTETVAAATASSHRRHAESTHRRLLGSVGGGSSIASGGSRTGSRDSLQWVRTPSAEGGSGSPLGREVVRRLVPASDTGSTSAADMALAERLDATHLDSPLQDRLSDDDGAHSTRSTAASVSAAAPLPPLPPSPESPGLGSPGRRAPVHPLLVAPLPLPPPWAAPVVFTTQLFSPAMPHVYHHPPPAPLSMPSPAPAPASAVMAGAEWLPPPPPPLLSAMGVSSYAPVYLHVPPPGHTVPAPVRRDPAAAPPAS
jgi:hypothetical protein